MTKGFRILVSLSLFFLLAVSAQAEVRLPRLLGDHMILQRDSPIHVWGTADPGEQISIHLHAQTVSVKASDLGLWSVYLAPEPAGGPFQLEVQGTNALTLSDVLIGDVWVASGQSNMEFPLEGFPGGLVAKDTAQQIAQADHPQIRLIKIPKKSSYYPLNDVDAKWTVCMPETARKISAVAYFFVREIQERENIPVGLIDATWGGTPAEAWTSLDALTSDSSLMPVLAVGAYTANEAGMLPQIASIEKWQDDAAKAAGQTLPKHPFHQAPLSAMPGGLFNGMIAPVTPLSIKGVIWYQGESNARLDRVAMYQKLFPALINDWRAKWREGNFPFLFVQISSYNQKPPISWGSIREAQRRTLSVANTAMAVSLDVGDTDNIHPPDKQTVGHRLALAARALVYNEPIEFSGPLFRRAVPEGSAMRVWFDHDRGLTSRIQDVEGFEIAGADRNFVPAAAHVEHGSVLVSSPEVPEPKYVRYGWANFAVTSLLNSAGLPASTFTSEEELVPLRSCCTMDIQNKHR